MSVWHYTPWGYFTYERPRDRTQYIAQGVVGGFLPPVGAYHRMRDSLAYMDDYVTNRGVDYGDFKYPSLTTGYSGVSSAGASLRTVSRNVESLYKTSSYDKGYRAGQKRGFLDGRYYYSR